MGAWRLYGAACPPKVATEIKLTPAFRRTSLSQKLLPQYCLHHSLSQKLLPQYCLHHSLSQKLLPQYRLHEPETLSPAILI